MSHVYHLICRESRMVLDLGKFVNKDESGNPLPIQFTGWIDQSTSIRVTRNDLLRAIECFMAVNIGRKIEIINNAELHKLDPNGIYQYIDSVEEMVNMAKKYFDNVE